MIQFILHLVGDYLLQNDWMAQNKKKPGINGFLSCFVHCLLYSIPFLFFYNLVAVLIIFLFHFIIDRYYFVKWYMDFVGQKDFSKPPFSPWSILAVDNTFHLLINYIIISSL